ncbi:MAG: hypothetical protein WB992_03555, partial [Bryobacteraceae bacterium]
MRLIVPGTLGFMIALPLGIHLSGLLMNYTDSVPVGLYRKTLNSAAPYAGFCLERVTVDSARQAGLEIVPGNCPGGVAPILKPLIYPSREQPLMLSARGFFVNGRLLANTAPKSRSRTGAALEHYAFGTYSSGVWAVSDFNRDSFDSRYFGPVAPGAIRFYATPVWTW